MAWLMGSQKKIVCGEYPYLPVMAFDKIFESSALRSL